MTLPQDVIGVDIAMGWIDTFTLSTRKHARIATPKPALAQFARAAKDALVVCEAAGGSERPLTSGAPMPEPDMGAGSRAAIGPGSSDGRRACPPT